MESSEFLAGMDVDNVVLATFDLAKGCSVEGCVELFAENIYVVVDTAAYVVGGQLPVLHHCCDIAG